MPRMYFVQHWFKLADAACEEASLDSTALRRFVGIDLGRERVPDATTLGEQWYFGMKLHIGVDSQTGLAHRAVVTAANVHDKHPLPDLLHGQEKRVYGDCAYASQGKLIGPRRGGPWTAPTRRCARAASPRSERMINRAKSRVRARVEHVFGVIKRLWGFGKVRYRGLAKNGTRSSVALGLANIYLARAALYARVRP